MKTPCKGCEYREVACHVKCPAYRMYKQQMELQKENTTRQNDVLAYIGDNVLKWDQFHECSARLRSALILADYYNKEYGDNYFIETIDMYSFRKIRNAGRKTWAEFVRLRGY